MNTLRLQPKATTVRPHTRVEFHCLYFPPRCVLADNVPTDHAPCSHTTCHPVAGVKVKDCDLYGLNVSRQEPPVCACSLLAVIYFIDVRSMTAVCFPSMASLFLYFSQDPEHLSALIAKSFPGWNTIS